MIEMPIPTLGAHDVLCKVVCTGVCGTDQAIYSGELSFVKNGMVKFPLTMGHEWAGIVAEVGAEVRQQRVGDRVTGDTGVACGHCTACLNGQYHRCKSARSVGTVNAWDGAYAEYIVMPERHLFRLPEGVTFEQGAMTEPAATAHLAVRYAEVSTGDIVLVHGTGPIGIMAAKLAKLAGASCVIITGRKTAKLQAALNFGADATINTTSESVRDAVSHLVGADGVDKVIETSGAVELLLASFPLLRTSGIISTLAFYEQELNQVPIDELVIRGLTLRGVCGSLGMYPATLQLMAAGMFDPAQLITARYPFQDVLIALDDMTRNNETRIKLLLEM